MKIQHISILAILGLFFGVLTAQAQQIDPPSMELDSGPADTSIQAVSAVPIRADSTGGALAPTLYNEGTELDDIGAPAQTHGDVQPDPIGVTDAGFTPEREMKESGEKGGTADMNIGIGEMQETTGSGHKDWIIIESMGSPLRMNKAELIDSIASDSGEGLRTTGGYIKIGDIKGESQDKAANGDLDVDDEGDSIPTQASKKPKEIVVVGSLVRSENVHQLVHTGTSSDTHRADSFFDIWTEISTDEDLLLHVVSVAQNNPNIAEIHLGESVQVREEVQVKLFGILPIQVTRTLSVDPQKDEGERVKVRFPWWHFLSTKDVNPDDLAGELEDALSKDIPEDTDADDRPTEEVAFYYNKIQAQTLQTISNVSK